MFCLVGFGWDVFKEHHIDIYIYKLLMWGRGKGHTLQRGARTQGLGRGRGGTQCYAKTATSNR